MDPEIKCYMGGVPRSTYMPYPFQIVQEQSTIMMAYEFAGAVRRVNMGEPTEAPNDSWMGWSNGHWEGETLSLMSRASMIRPGLTGPAIIIATRYMSWSAIRREARIR